MQGFYITGVHGSYIELGDGRWADSVFSDLNDDGTVEELLDELTSCEDCPNFSLMTMDELREYVGAE